jgi:biofilm PGA synthesis lipoprotein PgaB
MRRFAALAFTLFAVIGAAISSCALARDVVQVRAPSDLASAAPNTFTVISYHEVREDVRDYPDPFAVDVSALAAQFAWLRGNGYVPVSLDQILTARHGGRPLPDKAILLTFDDSYLSFYTRVYPLLREFRYPAVLAVVGKWIDNPPDVQLPYGEKGSVTDASFPSWAQLREMSDSGLVEIASHSYDLHHGVMASPQGNLQPAATARIYDPQTGKYEGNERWRARVRNDLAQNSRTIERETGRAPRVIVWPYGSYNDELIRMADQLGMSVALTLDDGPNTPNVPLTALRRILIEHNPPLADFISELRGPQFPDPVRMVQLSLDTLYDPDPAVQENKLSALLDRIKLLNPTHVLLQATTDTDGDGVDDAAYFPNQYLPLRADLFNRVAWQLSSRDDVKVFAVMPVNGLRLGRDEIVEVYSDLARHANFDGLLFMADGDRVKTSESIAFTQQLAQSARRWRGPLQIARSVTAQQPAGMLSTLADTSDYVLVTVPPERSIPQDPRDMLSAEALKIPPAKLVFMLSPNAQMAQQMRTLQLGGFLNFAYSGDDAGRDFPPLEQVAPVLSLRIHPR